MKEEPRAVCVATLREASYSVGRMSESQCFGEVIDVTVPAELERKGDRPAN
jgi:hypothetical protein